MSSPQYSDVPAVADASSHADSHRDPRTARVRIAVIEDDPVIARAIADRFRAEGWEVLTAPDGPQGVRLVAQNSPSAVVLDVMLPGMDGLEVCRRIQASSAVPVLMLTARDDEADMLVGLGVGADDYMTKPFSMRELVARLKALLRREERARDRAAQYPTSTEPERLTFGDLVIERSARRVSRGGQEAHLTRTEYDLLLCLASAPGAVLSRETLLEEVWDWVDATGTRTVDSHVKALRRKLGAELVRTVHGVGYSFEPPTQAPSPAHDDSQSSAEPQSSAE